MESIALGLYAAGALAELVGILLILLDNGADRSAADAESTTEVTFGISM